MQVSGDEDEYTYVEEIIDEGDIEYEYVVEGEDSQEEFTEVEVDDEETVYELQEAMAASQDAFNFAKIQSARAEEARSNHNALLEKRRQLEAQLEQVRKEQERELARIAQKSESKTVPDNKNVKKEEGTLQFQICAEQAAAKTAQAELEEARQAKEEAKKKRDEENAKLQEKIKSAKQQAQKPNLQAKAKDIPAHNKVEQSLSARGKEDVSNEKKGGMFRFFRRRKSSENKNARAGLDESEIKDEGRQPKNESNPKTKAKEVTLPTLPQEAKESGTQQQSSEKPVTPPSSPEINPRQTTNRQQSTHTKPTQAREDPVTLSPPHSLNSNPGVSPIATPNTDQDSPTPELQEPQKSPKASSTQEKKQKDNTRDSDSLATAKNHIQFFTVQELQTMAIPGLDYGNREKYLSPADFQKVFDCTKEEWENFPAWKKQRSKRTAGFLNQASADHGNTVASSKMEEARPSIVANDIVATQKVVETTTPPKKEGSESLSTTAAQNTSTETEQTQIYNVKDLRAMSIPGLDYPNREKYLSDADFQDLLSCTKEEWSQLPKWKKTKAKRDAKLF